ncbi:MAG TPA: VOC family protein [Propionibacteriaceae bacterium]|nr:VOC family protein [Propionibacteriaceae bacterium]
MAAQRATISREGEVMAEVLLDMAVSLDGLIAGPAALMRACSGGDEFAGKLYPPAGSSIQLLLQRLGSDDPATAVRAHIDLGADDIEAEATRLVGLGAEWLGPGRGWIVLRDPVGMVFCVTGNSPDNP